ncbi:hypothetical protein [Actinomadura montaniterrae]|uniref:Uncharacterized protein n=1 Tax=Actinomadura montaniterrae TaxID=1803903 RepID=A0A6L3W040_9ACTN|nr:hypothetical protein [Actinomadura montaniterrae]KAB2379294.1 hypothetical protein F9B16_21015 [Actinomadura montaniterrae]
MFTIPALPAVRAWRERAEARDRYADLTTWLHEVIDDLYVLTDHDKRAEALDLAGEIATELAELHTAAWGEEADEAGRPMRASLAGQAALLHQVADTERAVINAITWPIRALEPEGDHAAELRVWTQLAHTADPTTRAACLRGLHLLVGQHVGGRAAAILAVLAEIDEHRAAHGHTHPAAPRPPHWYRWSRPLITTVFGLLGLAAVVPGLDATTRLTVLLAIPAGVYAAQFIFFRAQDRRKADR